MPRYKVVGCVRVSAYTLVEADSEKEAIAIARDREGVLAPHGWSPDGCNPTVDIIIENADGTLFDCKIEPMDSGDKKAWIDQDEDENEDVDEDLDDLVDEDDDADEED